MQKKFKIAVIAGEASGDLLATQLFIALKEMTNTPIELVGIGGMHLEKLGLKSWFLQSDISVMGIWAVIKSLPMLYRRLRMTIKKIRQEKPDCLLIIDSPDFTHRVAASLKKSCPNLPIIQYVAPTVWAWRPKRAVKMQKFVDQVLALFPFEEEVMRALRGPSTRYIGHPLLEEKRLADIFKERKERSPPKETPVVLLLPGSRRMEIAALMPIFIEAVCLLRQQHPSLQVCCVTLPHLREQVESYCRISDFEIELCDDLNKKYDFFAKADVALAASGTVSLELALAAIPTILAYKNDFLVRWFLLRFIKIWSAALPNIIADDLVVPEHYDQFVRPEILMRQMRRYLFDENIRAAQQQGFRKVRQSLLRDKDPSHAAAEILLSFLEKPEAIV